jgi:hypothetical protein
MLIRVIHILTPHFLRSRIQVWNFSVTPICSVEEEGKRRYFYSSYFYFYCFLNLHTGFQEEATHSSMRTYLYIEIMESH